MDSSCVLHLLLELLEGVQDDLVGIHFDVKISKLIIKSLGIRELVELRVEIILIEIIASFAFLNFLVDFALHLIYGIMII